MASGGQYNLMLDSKGNVYSFGYNEIAQCGFDPESDGVRILLPKLLEISNKENIVEIKCGQSHSYLKTASLRHYLFGFNRDNYCTLSPNNKYKKRWITPFCINSTFRRLSNGKEIKTVYVGTDGTIIIAKSEDDMDEKKEEIKRTRAIKHKKVK